jgi:protease II
VCEDRKGDELDTLSFLDTSGSSPARLPESIQACSGSVAWANDDTIFYVTQDPKLHRADKVK